MIVVDAGKCSGCRRCEVACGFFHTGKVGRRVARVKTAKFEEIGIDVPVVCVQCRERYCLKCPESALQLGPLGQVVASPTLCTGCGTCEKLCPMGAIELYEEIPYVCDLCGGEPRCVAACNLDAIRFDPDLSGETSLTELRKAAKGLNPEQKRAGYARAITRELREQWLKGRCAS